MLSTQHLLVGAVIVKTIPNPLISLPLAFASHFLLDSIPHWDAIAKVPFNSREVVTVIAEYAFGVALVIILTAGRTDQELIWLGAFLGTLPDFITGTYKYLCRYFPNVNLLKIPLIRLPNEWHWKIQKNISFNNGLVVSTLTTLLAIFILLS